MVKKKTGKQRKAHKKPDKQRKVRKKTDKQRKAHMDYFTRLGIDTSCVVCGSEDWIIGRTGPAFDVGDGRKVMPVEIICNFCGRIATYDGRVIGNV